MKSMLIFFVLLSSFVYGQKSITPDQAKNHIGETVTICGEIKGTYFGEKIKGQPTFLNFGYPYPSQTFTALIWGSDRYKFQLSLTELKGKSVCITGKVIEYKGKPEIIVKDAYQLQTK